jgi:ferredoxin-type protein NapH
LTRWLEQRLRQRRDRWPGGKLWLQVLRRALQLAVLALLVLIPTLSHYDNLANQRDGAGIEAHFGTRQVKRLVAGWDEPEMITQAVRGSVWTMTIGDRVISDPLAGIDFACAARVIFDPFLLSVLIPLLLTLLLGRIFCGWICPADLLFEVGSWVRRWVGIETNVRFARSTMFAVLAIGAGAAFALGTQVFAEIYPPRLLSGELYSAITFGVVGAGAWFLLAIVAFEIFVSRRFWCRYVCPGGAVYAALGWQRLVRLTVRESSCTRCKKCLPACEFGLDPMNGAMGAECNNCGLCVRACEPKALFWRLGRRPSDGRDIAATDSHSREEGRADE